MFKGARRPMKNRLSALQKLPLILRLTILSDSNPTSKLQGLSRVAFDLLKNTKPHKMNNISPLPPPQQLEHAAERRCLQFSSVSDTTAPPLLALLPPLLSLASSVPSPPRLTSKPALRSKLSDPTQHRTRSPRTAVSPLTPTYVSIHAKQALADKKKPNETTTHVRTQL